MSQLAISFIAGMLTTLAPCVLPILPLVVGSALQQHKLGPLALAAGLAVAFTTLGLILVSFGAVLTLSDQTMRMIAAILLLITGIIMVSQNFQEGFKKFSEPLANKANTVMATISPEGLKGQFMLGLLLGIIWTPCSGPTLGAALGLAAAQGTKIIGAAMLATFAIGATIPLLAIAYGARQLFISKKEGISKVGHAAKKILGWILIILGIMVAAGIDKEIDTFLTNILPDGWLNLITQF